MNKQFLSASGMVLAAILAVSCSQESLNESSSSNEALVSLNITLPGSPATRAYSDGYSATDLYYAVYEADYSNLATEGKTTFDGSSLTTTVNVTLVKGVAYKLAFWAQAEGAPYTFSAADKTVTVSYDGAACNDEDRDAFYAVEDYTPTASTGTLDIDLYRPFAQLNFLTSDFAEDAVADYVAGMKSSIAITGNAYTTLNLLTGEAGGAESVTFAAAAIPTSADYDEVPVAGYDYVAMAYVLVGASTSESTDVFNDVTLEATSANTAGTSMDVKVSVDNVPVQRNYRTNIYGALLTETTTVTVEIAPAYDGAYNNGDEEGEETTTTLSVTAVDGNDALTFDETTGIASLAVAADSESYSFDITADSETSWTVESDNEAFEVTSVAKTAISATGTGNATVTVTYPTNETTSEVKANITITAGETILTIAITQTAAESTGGDDTETTAKGTADNPYTVAEALVLINSDSCPTEEVYVKGIISSVSSYSSTYGSINYYISDDGSTDSDQLYAYGGLNLGKAKFSAKDDISTGVEVIICGVLTLYTNSSSTTTTPEIDSNNYLVSYNGVTDYLYTSVSSLSVSSGGGEVSFTVTTNVEYTVTSSDATNFAAKAADGTVTVTCEANTGADARTATITVTPDANSGASAVEVVISQTAPRTGNAVYYEKVTSEPDSWAGTYLIVYEDGPYAFDGSLTTLDAANDYQEVTLTDYGIESTEAVDAILFTIAAVDGGYSIQSASGYYIGQDTDENKLSSSTSTVYVNTIEYDATDGAKISGAAGAVLRFNSASNQMRFRYYKTASYSNQKAIALYKLAEATE